MKKIFLLLCLALVTLVANAGKSPYDTKEKVINRAKVIVAYHFMSQKKDAKFTKDPIKEQTKDVDALLKLIENKAPKYEKICEEIKSKDFDAVDKPSLIEQFKKYLSEMGVKEQSLDHASTQLEKMINGSDFPFKAKDEEEGDTDEGEEDDGAPKSIDNEGTSPSSQGTIITNKGNDPTSEDDKGISKSEIISPILPIGILVLLLILLGLYCFQLWRNNKILQEEKRDVVKYLSQINSAYAKKSLSSLANAVLVKYKEVTDHNKTLEKKIKELEEKVEKAEKAERKFNAYNNPYSTNRGNDYGNVSPNVVKSEESHSPTVTWDIDNSERFIHESESPKASLVGKEMFLYLPNDNMFKEGSEEYRSGKTLYKMVYTSEETADFEFVNRPEALAFAKQSRSRFLEGACFIENDDAISFNTIQTLEKGKLAKADEGWNIISKARIRLS